MHAAETRDAARAELVDAWDRDRQAHPDASRIILTHTNDEVRALNGDARVRLKASGALGAEVAITVERGERMFAENDRVMFLQNERSIGVKNGSLGTVQNIDRMRMAVMLDDGRCVAFDLKDYAHIDHGYAATIHKAQGMTVDRVQVLATPGVDSHSTYVALSRHREHVDVYYGRDDFATRNKLVRAVSRERGKDMASDYRTPAPAKAVEPKRGMFDGLKLTVSREAPNPATPERQRPVKLAEVRVSARSLEAGPSRSPLDKAVERFAGITKQIVDVRRAGGKELPHELDAYRTARAELDALRPGSANDLREAFGKSYQLTKDAAEGRAAGAMAEMDRRDAGRAAERAAAERAARDRVRLAADTEKRADLFVATWKKESDRSKGAPTYAARDAARANLSDMAKSLHRDPQLESLLQNRRAQLGLDVMSTKRLSQDLQLSLGRGRGMGIGM